MGDWYFGNDRRWHYDENAPTPGSSPSVTAMMPAVPARDDSVVDLYEREDGAVYARIDPDWFEPYDEVDSTTIDDDGGPPDAA